jgi:hypothetical protein
MKPAICFAVAALAYASSPNGGGRSEGVPASSRPRPSRAVADINAETCLRRLSESSVVGGTGFVFAAVESISTIPATSSGYCAA